MAGKLHFSQFPPKKSSHRRNYLDFSKKVFKKNYILTAALGHPITPREATHVVGGTAKALYSLNDEMARVFGIPVVK